VTPQPFEDAIQFEPRRVAHCELGAAVPPEAIYGVDAAAKRLSEAAPVEQRSVGAPARARVELLD
jgi:hypothetical protein